jgi:hypothetical protein
MPRLLMIIVTAIAIASCASITHNFTLHSRDGGQSGEGEARERGREISIVLDGHVYRGQYLIDAGKVVTSTNVGSANAYSGAASANVTGRSTTNTYIPGSGMGSCSPRRRAVTHYGASFNMCAAVDSESVGTTAARNLIY